jgi:hypothetical protein
VHPDLGEAGLGVGAAALGDLVLVVRELEVDAASVDIEARAQEPGEGQPGRVSSEGFQRTKSIGSSLKGATSTRAPAIMSSTERPESWP